jgi:hypothetical protein
MSIDEDLKALIREIHALADKLALTNDTITKETADMPFTPIFEDLCPLCQDKVHHRIAEAIKRDKLLKPVSPKDLMRRASYNYNRTPSYLT